MKKIYLAGGCFWGVEHYFSLIKGVINTKVGYANSRIANPSYEDVKSHKTDAAETVEIIYDENTISLNKLLYYYFSIIDPTSINKQGEDVGSQYRTGIYYVDNAKDIIDEAINDLSKKYDSDIVIEVMPLINFYDAEDYHQNYLYKNPNGYCHIPIIIFEDLKRNQ